MSLLAATLLASFVFPQVTPSASHAGVSQTRQAISSRRGLPSSSFGLVDASNGFGLMLPHTVFELDGLGNPTANVLEIRSLDVLYQNATPSNPVRPVTIWPTMLALPNGQAGNQYLLARFSGDLAIDSVLSSSASGGATSQLTGAITVTATNPVTGQAMQVVGRAFIGGKTYGSADPLNPGQLALEQWIGVDGNGKPIALNRGAGMPGLGFPATEQGFGFANAAQLVADSSFVFIPDADGDLTTHESFPVGQVIKLDIRAKVQGVGGRSLKEHGVAVSQVGSAMLSPEVVLPGGTPGIIPSNGDINVDPETDVTIQFTEPVRIASIGTFPGGASPSLSAAIQLSFGLSPQVVQVPFTVRPASVFDFTRVVLQPAFAFPGSGGGGLCGVMAQISVNVSTSGIQDLEGNTNLLALSTFFQTGDGPGLVNAPVTPDAIYVARGGSEPGISVIDLNGFGAGTGDPTYDVQNPIVEGNSNYPNNPNLSVQGLLLTPPLTPGQCTTDGGSAGVFTLTKDSSLNDLVMRSPLLDSAGDIALGHPLDLTFNASTPFGCQSGGGNICAATGLKLVTLTQTGPSTCGPSQSGSGGGSLIGFGNLASFAPHPNPPPLVFPPLVFPPLCLSPAIGGQEPTSATPFPNGSAIPNLLAPGANFLGDPSIGLPPTSLLAKEQNAWFQGPSAPQPSIQSCATYGVRQQIGQFLYCIDRAAGQVLVLNSNRFTVIERIDLPDPTALAISPGLDFLAVSSEGTNKVYFIDVSPGSSSFHEIVTETTVGLAPNRMAWEPTGEDLFVCNTGANSVSIVSGFTLQVRKTIGGLLGQSGATLASPVDVVVTPRQLVHGWKRGTYYAYVVDSAGQLALFESGPGGVSSIGYDDFIGVAPQHFENPKAIQPDLHNIFSAVWVAHERSLQSDGSLGPLGEGAVSTIRLTSTRTGPQPLAPSEVGMPDLRGFGFEVVQSVGGDVLTGVPVDLAFDDQRNLTTLPGVTTPFSPTPTLRENSKALVRLFQGSTPVPVSNPALLFVAIPSSSEGPGVVDVLSLGGALSRVDTNPFQAGVQSIPASGVTGVAGYLRQ